MVISTIIIILTRKVKEFNMSVTKTIVLKVKVVKLHAQRMAGHLSQDVSVRVSVLTFCHNF